MAKSVRTGAYPDKTPDGKDIVYVAMPSIETTEQYVADRVQERKAREADVLAGTRLQLIQHARDLVTYHRATADEPTPQTLKQRVDQIIAVAEELEEYVLGGAA